MELRKKGLEKKNEDHIKNEHRLDDVATTLNFNWKRAEAKGQNSNYFCSGGQVLCMPTSVW